LLVVPSAKNGSVGIGCKVVPANTATTARSSMRANAGSITCAVGARTTSVSTPTSQNVGKERIATRSHAFSTTRGSPPDGWVKVKVKGREVYGQKMRNSGRDGDPLLTVSKEQRS